MASHQIPSQDDQSGLIPRFYLSCEFQMSNLFRLKHHEAKKIS